MDFNGFYNIDSRLLFHAFPIILTASFARCPLCFRTWHAKKLFGEFRLIDADEFFAEAEAEEQHVLEMERERCFDGTEIDQGHCVPF